MTGVPVMQIVKYCGLSWYSVNKAIKLYKEGADSLIKSSARGRKQGTGRILSDQQETEIRNIICKQRPYQNSIKADLWSRNAVMQLIEHKSGIKLSVRGVGNYLKRWGFVLKTPVKRPYDRCSSDIRKWLDDKYPKIEQQAQLENAQIYWASKTRVNTLLSEKLWMISAVNNQGKVHWLVIKSRFTQAQQIKVLKALIKVSRQKVFLIRNDSKIYSEGLVLDWIRENKDKIKLFPDMIT